MRDIGKYRGQRKDNGEWVYGWYIKTDFAVYIVPAEYVVDWKVFVEVIPETVGESTGLKDKNGVEIYEGDKAKGKCTYQKHQVYNPFVGVVEWSEQYAAFEIRSKDSDGDLLCPMFDEVVFAELEVIGNIHKEEPCQP